MTMDLFPLGSGCCSIGQNGVKQKRAQGGSVQESSLDGGRD